MVSIVLNFINDGYCTLYWLNLCLVITLNLTGAFHCLVYGITNKSLRRNYTLKQGLFYFFASPILLLPAALLLFFKGREYQENQMATVKKEEKKPLFSDTQITYYSH